MKRLLSYIYLLAAVSCAEIAGPDVSQTPQAPVPVEFALAKTKGAIYGEADLVNNSSMFGMFAINPECESISDNDGLNLRNQLCRYVEATETEKATLKFGYASEDKKIYFPMNSSVNYDFYTYHRWTSKLVQLADGTSVIVDTEEIQDVSEMTSTDRQVFVSLGLASHYDVLWSKSVAEPIEVDGKVIEGFNAAYVSKTGKVPSFQFRHPAAGIRFSAVLSEGSLNTILKRDHLRITEISYTGADSRKITTEAALCIVDLDNNENEGKFTKVLSSISSKKWLNMETSSGALSFDVLADADGDGVTETCHTEPVQIHSEAFIMPMDEPLEVTISMRRQRVSDAGAITGNWPEVKKTFILDPKKFGAEESGYKAGKMYNYKIVVDYTNPTPGTPANDVIDFEVVAE